MGKIVSRISLYLKFICGYALKALEATHLFSKPLSALKFWVMEESIAGTWKNFFILSSH